MREEPRARPANSSSVSDLRETCARGPAGGLPHVGAIARKAAGASRPAAILPTTTQWNRGGPIAFLVPAEH